MHQGSSPPVPGNFSGQMPSGGFQVGMNPTVFEEAIRAHGVRMIHSKPLLCPKRRDLYTPDHDPNCKQCQNGFLYYEPKEFIGLFQGNSNNRNFGMNGTFDVDQVMITVPTKYLDGTELDAQFYDQIAVVNDECRYFQLIEHSVTGRDRLHFPAIDVDKLIDFHGREYTIGIDFALDGGDIVWTGTERPGYDITIDRGVIYSVNYYTRPIFTVIALPHQFRSTQQKVAGGGAEARFPQSLVCRKEFILKNPDDPTGSDTPVSVNDRT
jgi:hypothetical protein